MRGVLEFSWQGSYTSQCSTDVHCCGRDGDFMGFLRENKKSRRGFHGDDVGSVGELHDSFRIQGLSQIYR